jgi:hypothetical protein
VSKIAPIQKKEVIVPILLLVESLFLLVSASANLAFSDSSQSPGWQMRSADPDFSPSGMKRRSANAWALPTRSEVIRLIASSGLGQNVLQMDALDQDHLILRVKNFPFDELLHFYPNLPRSNLRKLYQTIHAKDENNVK